MANMLIGTECPECGKIDNITVDEDDFDKWRKGLLIQNAFPYLSATQREQLVTGYCGPCWDKVFADE